MLRPLLPGLWDALQPGGWLVLSGLPADEWDGFAHDVVRAGFVLHAVDADGEWRSGLFRRPAGRSAGPHG